MEGKGDYTTSYKLFENDNYNIFLVENYPCNSKDELLSRERFYIENNECVNKCIPCRTRKEYIEANKDKIKEQTKEYREANKDKIKQMKAEYREANKDKIKEYYEKNKDKINARKRETRKLKKTN